MGVPSGAFSRIKRTSRESLPFDDMRQRLKCVRWCMSLVFRRSLHKEVHIDPSEGMQSSTTECACTYHQWRRRSWDDERYLAWCLVTWRTIARSADRLFLRQTSRENAFAKDRLDLNLRAEIWCFERWVQCKSTGLAKLLCDKDTHTQATTLNQTVLNKYTNTQHNNTQRLEARCDILNCFRCCTNNKEYPQMSATTTHCLSLSESNGK